MKKVHSNFFFLPLRRTVVVVAHCLLLRFRRLRRDNRTLWLSLFRLAFLLRWLYWWDFTSITFNIWYLDQAKLGIPIEAEWLPNCSCLNSIWRWVFQRLPGYIVALRRWTEYFALIWARECCLKVDFTSVQCKWMQALLFPRIRLESNILLLVLRRINRGPFSDLVYEICVFPRTRMWFTPTWVARMQCISCWL